jgi:hypothetical protein
MVNALITSHTQANHVLAAGMPSDIDAYFSTFDHRFSDPNFDKNKIIEYKPSDEVTPPLPQYQPSFLEAKSSVATVVQDVHRHIMEEPSTMRNLNICAKTQPC